MSNRTHPSDSAEKTKTIKWNWNKDAFINDQQTQYPGIRVESMFEGVGRLVYEVESLIDAVIRFYAYSAHRYSDNRPIIMEKELDSHEYINELEGSIFVKVMREIAGKARVGSADDVEILQNVLKERDYFLHTFFHEYNKKRLEAGWMDEKINQLKAALVLASGLTEKYRDAVDLLVDGINRPKKKKYQKPANENDDGDAGEAAEAEDEETDSEEDPADSDEDSPEEEAGQAEESGETRGERPYDRDRRPYDRPRNNNYHNDRRDYQRRDGGRPRNNNYHNDGGRYNDRRSYGDRPRNNYNRDGPRDGGYQRRDGDYRSKPRYDDGPRDRRPYGDRPRNDYQRRDGDRPRRDEDYRSKPRYDDRRSNGGYQRRDGDYRGGQRNRRPYDRPRNDGYRSKPRYDDRDGGRDYREKRPYKPRDSDKKDE